MDPNTLENIKRHLDIAATKHTESKPFYRDESILESFAYLEIERFKFLVGNNTNLGNIGMELSAFIMHFNALILKMSFDLANGDGQGIMCIQFDVLEHFIIKILAIANILMSKDNKEVPITVCSINNSDELWQQQGELQKC